MAALYDRFVKMFWVESERGATKNPTDAFGNAIDLNSRSEQFKRRWRKRRERFVFGYYLGKFFWEAIAMVALSLTI